MSFFADMDPETDEVEQGAGAGVVLATDPGSVVPHERPADLHGRSGLPESPFDARPVMTPPMFFDVTGDIELEHDLDEDDWAAWDRLYQGLGAARSRSRPVTTISSEERGAATWTRSGWEG